MTSTAADIPSIPGIAAAVGYVRAILTEAMAPVVARVEPDAVGEQMIQDAIEHAARVCCSSMPVEQATAVLEAALLQLDGDDRRHARANAVRAIYQGLAGPTASGEWTRGRY